MSVNIQIDVYISNMYDSWHVSSLTDPHVAAAVHGLSGGGGDRAAPVGQDHAGAQDLRRQALRQPGGSAGARLRRRGSAWIPVSIRAGRRVRRGAAVAGPVFVPAGHGGRGPGAGTIRADRVTAVRPVVRCDPVACRAGGHDPAAATVAGGVACIASRGVGAGWIDAAGHVPGASRPGPATWGLVCLLCRHLRGARRAAGVERAGSFRVPAIPAPVRGPHRTTAQRQRPGRRDGDLQPHRTRLAVGAGGQRSGVPVATLPPQFRQAAGQVVQAVLRRYRPGVLAAGHPQRRNPASASVARRGVRDVGGR